MSVLSLRARIRWWFVGLSAVLLTVLVTWVSWQGRVAAHAALDRELSLRAESLGALCEVEDGQLVCEVRPESMQQFAGGPTVRAFVVQSWPGRSTIVAGGAFDASALTLPAVEDHWRSQRFLGRRLGERELRVLEVVRDCGSGADGSPFAVRIVVAEDLAPLAAAAWQQDRLLVLAALGTLLLFVGAGWFVARRLVDPLAQLASSASRVQAGHPGNLPATGNGDEIDRLTATLNDAFNRLQAALARQTRFTADASHELRTPLAIMRTEVEVALQRPRDGGDYRATLAEVLNGVTRMTALVEGLLLLARTDADANAEATEHVALLPLLQQVAAQHQPEAAAKAQRLVVDGDRGIAVPGDARLLAILVGNLLGNAIRYSERPGTIQVGVRGGDDGPVLTVVDEGIGIHAEHLPHLFDRFVRVDDDRSRRAGGSGLGLSIVQAIARRHGATCSITSEPGRGTAIEVRFGRRQQP